MIPKIIHTVWFSNSLELPDDVRLCMQSWKEKMPGYEIKLWNAENFDIKSNVYVAEAFKEKKFAFVSDYVRLWALYNYGGIYLDSDVEVLKSFDNLLSNKAITGFEDTGRIATFVFGSEKENPLFKEFMNYYNGRHFVLPDGTYDLTPNPETIAKILKSHGLNNKDQIQILENITVYPITYFCPFNPYREGGNVFSDKTYSNHHFSGSWKTSKASNKIKVAKKFSVKIRQNIEIISRIGLSGCIKFHTIRQHNNFSKIHFIYIIDDSNVGMANDCPADYYPDFYRFNVQKHDIKKVNFDSISKKDIVIFSGTELLDNREEWNKTINKVLSNCENVIFWGCNLPTEISNNHLSNSSLKITAVNIEKAKIFSSFQWNNADTKYLPCPSCKIQLLKKKYRIKRRVGIIEHKDFPINIDENFEKITNNNRIDFVLKFIGSSEILITNYYHAYFWGILMGKKVILENSCSLSKFRHLKYKTSVYSKNLEEDIKNAPVYPEALQESIELTDSFYKEIISYYG